ncbi:MAG: FAD-linked oxidase C-terminal domain-containing protein [Desulfobacteraceae bacterium]
MANLSEKTLDKIAGITGENHMTADREELLCYSYDAAGKSACLPDAVVFPADTDQVSRLMKLAGTEGFSVIPRGSGSGMTGGSVPVTGGVVMVFSRMNRILEIDRENFVARVEPGVIVKDLHDAAAREGLFYPPDPASSPVCTIGGNVAECAGGPRAVKYGVTRDYVLGLSAVLPSGEVIRTGVRTAKGVAGYDLTRLIVGSEGTLAVVTQIVLKLITAPEVVKTMAAVFDSMETAAAAVSAVMRDAVLPRCVEYIDRASLDCVKESLAFEISESVQAMLIIEVDGAADCAEKEYLDLADFLRINRASDVYVSSGREETEKLWQARKALSPALFRIAPDKINEDIVVPVSRIPDMVAAIKETGEKYSLFMASFGHAGDGNIHCNIMYDSRDAGQASRARKAVDEIFRYTLKLGGSITGEHGVGITKMKYLPAEISETEIRIMKQIKQLFDPSGILNPGKIFY